MYILSKDVSRKLVQNNIAFTSPLLVSYRINLVAPRVHRHHCSGMRNYEKMIDYWIRIYSGLSSPSTMSTCQKGYYVSLRVSL